MICPHCHPTCNGIEHDGCQLSTVRVAKINGVPPGAPQPDRQPKDHFFDEHGVEHSHDPNVVVTEFKCSNGHRFIERSSWQCFSCDFMACRAEVIP